MTKTKLEKDVVYLVESDRDETVLLAMDAQLKERAIEWFDTVRDRAFVPVTKVEAVGEEVRFQTPEAKYAMRKLTKELYEAKVAAKVDGHPRFATTDAVQRFYRQFPR